MGTCNVMCNHDSDEPTAQRFSAKSAVTTPSNIRDSGAHLQVNRVMMQWKRIGSIDTELITGDACQVTAPQYDSQMNGLGYELWPMSRECSPAGGTLLGVTKRSQRHAWSLFVPGIAPWVDSITFDGLSKAVIFQGSETEVLPIIVTQVGIP